MASWEIDRKDGGGEPDRRAEARRLTAQAIGLSFWRGMGAPGLGNRSRLLVALSTLEAESCPQSPRAKGGAPNVANSLPGDDLIRLRTPPVRRTDHQLIKMRPRISGRRWRPFFPFWRESDGDGTTVESHHKLQSTRDGP